MADASLGIPLKCAISSASHWLLADTNLYCRVETQRHRAVAMARCCHLSRTIITVRLEFNPRSNFRRALQIPGPGDSWVICRSSKFEQLRGPKFRVALAQLGKI